MSVTSSLETLLDVLGRLTVAWLGGEVGVTLLGVTSNDGTGAFSVLTLTYVDLRRSVVSGRTVDSVEFPVVGLVLDVELGSDVTFVRLLVSVDEREKGQL